MSMNKIYSFKAIKKKLMMLVSIGCFLIVVGVWLVLLLVSLSNSIDFPLILLKVFLLFSALISFVYAYYLISSLFNTTLEISETGILYKLTDSSIFCKWGEITGFKYSDNQLFLKCNHLVEVKGGKLGKTFGLVNHEIPIHLFIDSKLEQDDWKNNEVLLEIKRFAPRIYDDISVQRGFTIEE